MGEQSNITDLLLPFGIGLAAASNPQISTGLNAALAVIRSREATRLARNQQQLQQQQLQRQRTLEAPQLTIAQALQGQLTAPGGIITEQLPEGIQGPPRGVSFAPGSQQAVLQNFSQLLQSPEGQSLLASGGLAPGIQALGRARTAGLQERELGLRERQFALRREQAAREDFQINVNPSLNQAGVRSNIASIFNKRTGKLVNQIDLGENPQQTRSGLLGILRDVQNNVPGAQQLLEQYTETSKDIALARQSTTFTKLNPDGSVTVVEGPRGEVQDVLSGVAARTVQGELRDVADAASTIDLAIKRIDPQNFGRVPATRLFVTNIKDVLGEAFGNRHMTEFEETKRSVLQNEDLFTDAKSARAWRSAFRSAKTQSMKSLMTLIAFKTARALQGGRLSDQDFIEAAKIVGLKAPTADLATAALKTTLDMLRIKANTLQGFSGLSEEVLRTQFPGLFSGGLGGTRGPQPTEERGSAFAPAVPSQVPGERAPSPQGPTEFTPNLNDDQQRALDSLIERFRGQ